MTTEEKIEELKEELNKASQNYKRFQEKLQEAQNDIVGLRRSIEEFEKFQKVDDS